MVLLWVGVIQRDPDQSGSYRDYKWLRSDVTIDRAMIFGPYIDGDAAAGCGLVQPYDDNNPDYRLHDDDCEMKYKGFLCEW